MIYVQLPRRDPVTIIRKYLKEEEHFESVVKQPSFRAELLRKLLKEIENQQNESTVRV